MVLQGENLPPIKLPPLSPKVRVALLRQPLGEPEGQSWEYAQGDFPLTMENKPQFSKQEEIISNQGWRSIQMNLAE